MYSGSDETEKKRKVDHKQTNHARHASSSKRQPSVSLPISHSSKPLGGQPIPETYPLKPAPSTVLTKLANLNDRPREALPNEIVRSSGFSDKPQAPPLEPLDVGIASNRDDRLALVEDLEVGPVDHKPPFDDPHFEYLEPNSGIRLS
jgi:minichromosome maintenance protein 10